MVIYLDVLFAVNLIMDYATLAAAAGLSGVHMKRTRLLGASAAGASYAVLAAVQPWAGFLLIRLLAGLGICWIAYAGKKPFVRLCALYFTVAAAFAGTAAALGAVTGRPLLVGAGYYAAVPLRVLLLAAAVGYAVSGVLLRGDALHGPLRREVETLSVRFLEREGQVRVLHDTGNLLSEPVSGRPAIVVSKASAAQLLGPHAEVLDGLSAENAAGRLALLPPELARRFGLLPYRAVGTNGGLLLYFRPDSVSRADGTALDCVLAVSPDSVGQGVYDGLIGV